MDEKPPWWRHNVVSAGTFDCNRHFRRRMLLADAISTVLPSDSEFSQHN